jgi:glycerol-3-phosphate dehydrogenase (NAD(P)+)
VTRAAVVGGGAWGTAIADLLARNGHPTTMWAREADVVDDVNAAHRNSRFLAGADLHPTLRATASLDECVSEAELVIYAPPSHALRAVAAAAAGSIAPGATLAVATKGIERETLLIMTDVVASEVAGHAVVALSGPSFAAEVAARQPTAIVAASTDRVAARRAQQALSSADFRVYTNDDVIGVELGGALKNVVAVGTGIVEGLGLGYNSRAALITRGLAEIARLGAALGAKPATFAGLAGVGDLVLTCTGALSRNRSAGVEIGKGRSLEQVLADRETVAEGVVNTESAYALAERAGVEMPIVRAVRRILFEGAPARDAIGELMARELRPELDD